MVNFICCYVLFGIIMEVPAIHIFANDVPTLLRLLKRRNIESSDESVLDVPQSIEDLPEAEPIHPGHTLLQPSFKMLKSAVKYPQKSDTALVYGNLDNLGITYGKTSQRVLYTNFRKSNDLNETRRKKKSKSKHKDSDTSYEKSTSESESSSESDHERNPGNPYTVFKDKYKQNWLWNHAMDGDHMNVNPYAPQFASVGPSGAALFFGRKWWYYNQLVVACNAVSWRRQLEHIAKSRLQSRGRHIDHFFPSRRFYQYDPRELSSIIAVPSRVSHLPEAEPIMPGHTLLRPSFGMLKSSLKFPHKEMVDGAGVYGNVNNLGIK